jgi:hypothetical protein
MHTWDVLWDEQAGCLPLNVAVLWREVIGFWVPVEMVLSPSACTGKVIASTVAENALMMDALLGAKPVAFKPSIPHLIYQ